MERIQPKKKPTRQRKVLPQGRAPRRLPPVHTLVRREIPDRRAN